MTWLFTGIKKKKHFRVLEALTSCLDVDIDNIIINRVRTIDYNFGHIILN